MEKKESKLFVKEKKKKKEIIDKSKFKKYLCDHKVEEDLCVKLIDEDKKIVKCKLCGAEFKIEPIGTPEIKAASKTIKNVMNCIKIKGEHGNKSYLPLEVRNEFAKIELFLDSVCDLYTKMYVEKIDNGQDEEEYSPYSYGYNGALELSSNGGPIIGGATNFKKNKKHKDVTSLLGKKNKNKKKKNKGNNNWY